MRTFLFDFDGTLVDSMPDYEKIMKSILDEHRIPYGDDLMKIITPLGYRGTAEYYVREMGLEESVDALVARMHALAREAYAYHIPAKEGVTETLREMKSRGYCLNVLTASPHSALDPCLERLGIWELFSNVWSCEDFSTTKADPAIYLMAAEAIGEDVGSIIFVDDNVNAVRVARKAGMISYGIFDPSSAEYREEMRRVSHRYVEAFSELLEDLDEEVPK